MQNQNTSSQTSLLRVGIIGFGFMGKTHYHNLKQMKDVEVRAIFSYPSSDELTRLSEEEHITLYCNSVNDWERLLDEENLDMVVIATPTPTHKDIAIAAAAHGKHIFLEKPMARTIADCNAILEAVSKYNVKLFVGHVLRFWPSYHAVKNALTQKGTSIGEVKQIRALRYSAFPSWSEWFKSEELSGGCILDLSIHDIDFSYWIIGKPVDSVFCNARKMKEYNIDNWGMSMTTLMFKDGEIAHCEASWMATEGYGFGTSFEVIGTEGIIRFDSKNPAPVVVYGKNQIESQDPYSEDGYFLEMRSFVDSIKNDTEPEVSGQDGLMAVALCLAAIQSAYEGKPIKVEEVLSHGNGK